ncbi:Hsp70 family protein [Litchfieldia alkalitelluris]|uniref:Hsp70 family protein n=1 Tax=Litchfieldia alkalitelluris TaxID=304268 RepID=UPI000998034F|nr:Hsp70 family protein [Litchfieldia alkalitelluris]
MAKVKKVYGIDLGTTYSCISIMDEHDKAIVLKNADGERITPSVVYFEEDGSGQVNIDVGMSAKNYAEMYPNDVVSYIKRQMGTDYEFEHKGQSYRAEEISALILKKLVKDAELTTGEIVEDVVITVPAYFGVNEREATKKAGEIAGLNVIDLINEPTAAALSYGITKQSDKRILVYDLGGGTFDVTLIDVSSEAIDVIVTGGDHNLGGKNWDDAIVEYLVDQYKEQTGDFTEDILMNPETAQSLQSSAEVAKKTLSAPKRFKAPITFSHNFDRVRVELTREKLDEVTSHLLERTIELTKLMLEDAKLKGPGKDQFDEIILVGGSTRMLQVKERLVEEFGMEPIMFDPDEAVAKGAALYGMQKSVQEWVSNKIGAKYGQGIGASQIQDVMPKLTQVEKEEILHEAATYFRLTPQRVESMANQTIRNVTSKSFGVVAHVVENGRDVERVVNLIKKNDTLPCKYSQIFGTYEGNQVNAKIQVMENEMLDEVLEKDYAMVIGDALLDLPFGLPENSPIEVTYNLNEDGTLEVTAVEVTEKGTVQVTVQTNSVINEEDKEKAILKIQDFVLN